MPQENDKTPQPSQVTSSAIPEPLVLPEPDKILLNEMTDVHRSVKKLFALLDLLDRPESEREDLGERLTSILADTREQLQILVDRLNALMAPESGIMAELARLRAAQDRTATMVERILALLNEPAD